MCISVSNRTKRKGTPVDRNVLVCSFIQFFFSQNSPVDLVGRLRKGYVPFLVWTSVSVTTWTLKHRLHIKPFCFRRPGLVLRYLRAWVSNKFIKSLHFPSSYKNLQRCLCSLLLLLHFYTYMLTRVSCLKQLTECILWFKLKQNSVLIKPSLHDSIITVADYCYNYLAKLNSCNNNLQLLLYCYVKTV